MSNKNNWWDDWYTIFCPKCGSRHVKKMNVYKYTFRKDKSEIQKYLCSDCGLEFWE